MPLVETRRCPMCGKTSTIHVSAEGLAKFEQGALVQDAFPEMEKDKREQLVTGTHPECWDKLFPPEDEE